MITRKDRVFTQSFLQTAQVSEHEEAAFIFYAPQIQLLQSHYLHQIKDSYKSLYS